MIRGDHKIAGHYQFKTPANGMSVDSSNHRLVEMPHLGQPRKTTRQVDIRFPPVVELLFTAIERLEVPPRGKNFFTGSGHQPHTEFRIIPQHDHGFINPAAQIKVDGIDFRAVQLNLQHTALTTYIEFVRSIFHCTFSPGFLFSTGCELRGAHYGNNPHKAILSETFFIRRAPRGPAYLAAALGPCSRESYGYRIKQ